MPKTLFEDHRSVVKRHSTRSNFGVQPASDRRLPEGGFRRLRRSEGTPLLLQRGALQVRAFGQCVTDDSLISPLRVKYSTYGQCGRVIELWSAWRTRWCLAASCMWPLRNQPVPVYHRLGPTQSVQWHRLHPVRYEVGAFSLSSDRLYCEAAAPCSNVNLNVVHIAWYDMIVLASDKRSNQNGNEKNLLQNSKSYGLFWSHSWSECFPEYFIFHISFLFHFTFQ